MDRLRERITVAENALRVFKEVLSINDPTAIERDAAIHRFEYTFEECLKAGKQFLFDVEGIDVGSPKGVIRSSREVDLLNEAEAVLALAMVNDRNLTVHTYNEELAIKIYSHLQDYYGILAKWTGEMRSRV